MPHATQTPRHADPAWTSRMNVSLDFNCMLEDVLGAEHGLKAQDVWAMQGPIMDAHRQIRDRAGAGREFLGFLELPYQSQDALDEVVMTANRLAALGDRHVVLGIGGSYLGARALIEALGHPFHNDLSREQRHGRPRIYYEGNGIDADLTTALLGMLPTARPSGVETAFTVNVISKSGTTLETAVAFRLMRERLLQVYGPQHGEYVVATTDAARGKLKAIADASGYTTFVIPDDVGGRYSVLTPVGLLPAAVAGLDVRELVAGARHMAERCKNPDLHVNPAYMYAALQFMSYQAGRGISVMAAWSRRLEYFTFWYDQLSAESLGKDGQGRIPVSTVNTRDLHSRGQEIQDGPRNTVVTNLVVERPDATLKVPAVEGDPDGLNYLAGQDMGPMVIKAMEGTAFAYAKAHRPTMNLMIPELNAFTMGQLIYLFELATVAEGYLMGINPMDQPGVEEYKKFMFGNLGRPDMARYREEFEARPRGSRAYVV